MDGRRNFCLLLFFAPAWISIVSSQQQGSRFGASSFQPFPTGFYAARGPSGATSVQNTHFGYVPNSNSRSSGRQTQSQSPPQFIGLQFPPKRGQGSPPPAPKEGDVAYDYYEEPEEDIIYQVGSDINNGGVNNPNAAIVGRGIGVGDRKPPLRLPPQSFTTAHLGSRSKLSGRPSSTSSQYLREHSFIPLVDEPEQQLLLGGRSVAGGRTHNNLAANKHLVGLLRSTTTTSTTTTPKSTTSRSRGRNITTAPTPTTRRPQSPSSSGNRFATARPPTSTTTTTTTTPKSVKKEERRYSLGASAPSGPSAAAAAGSGSGEDYTIEYIEYPGSPEDTKGPFEYYEVSEETAKAILANETKTAAPVVTSSSSMSVSKSKSSSSSINVTVPPPKEKVVVSVSSTKSIATPPPTSIAPSKVKVTEVPKDSLAAGAQTSPEYYEEEYSYRPSVSSSSSSSSSSSVEAGEDEQEQPAPIILRPTGRKLPSKRGEIPSSHFHTLVDIGDLDSDSRISALAGQSQHLEEHEEVISSTTTTTTPKPASIIKTTKTPVFGTIKFAEVSPNLLPKGFKLKAALNEFSTTEATSTTSTSPPTTTTTSTTTTTTTEKPKEAAINFDEVPSFLLPKGYKPLATQAPEEKLSTTTTTTSTTTTTPAPSSSRSPHSVSPLEAILSKVKFQEIALPGLVPEGYKTPANLLPPGYKEETVTTPTSTSIPPNLLPPGYKGSGPEIKFEIPLNLLPKGYKPSSEPVAESGTAKPPPLSAPPPPTPQIKKGPVFPTRPPGSGLVFPTKPGGARVQRPTSTEPPKADTPLPPRVTISGGWPVRKTTEFTGWPTQPTTPMPPTSSTSTTPEPSTTTKATTTTPTTTTTTPPPKRSPLGQCSGEVCRMEATVRITGGVKWKPEFADINTEEYKGLEVIVKRELDGAYRASGLAPWYKRVQIEGFNQGSVLVDYFVELEGVDRELSTADVVKVFHKSLLDSDPGDELPQEDTATSQATLRFGRFTIDPRYTDFKVVHAKSGKGLTGTPEPLIPQWGIAVIVIGLVSLLFVFILGIIVLVSRYKNSKKNTVSLTQEMLNEFNKSHMAVGGGGGGGVDNYGADADLYNMDDVWSDKQAERTFDRRPTKRSQGSTKGSNANYNIYDSWKTEWNGYYYNGNYYGDSGYAPSRRRSDYDTNF